MEGQPIRRRRWMRFSFATMLFLIACLCGFMGGYRYGYFAGDHAWKVRQSYPVTYNVSDLIAPSNLKQDMDMVVAAMNDAMTDMPKDSCAARPFPTNLSVVVAANDIVHQRIASILNDLRANRPNAVKEESESRNLAGRQWPMQSQK